MYSLNYYYLDVIILFCELQMFKSEILGYNYYFSVNIKWLLLQIIGESIIFYF